MPAQKRAPTDRASQHADEWGAAQTACVLQDVENVGGLVNAAADEAAEQRDVVVRDVAISDSAGLSISKVASRQQIVLESLEVGAVRRGRFAGST
jgi:hypothetical protein